MSWALKPRTFSRRKTRMQNVASKNRHNPSEYVRASVAESMLRSVVVTGLCGLEGITTTNDVQNPDVPTFFLCYVEYTYTPGYDTWPGDIAKEVASIVTDGNIWWWAVSKNLVGRNRDIDQDMLIFDKADRICKIKKMKIPKVTNIDEFDNVTCRELLSNLDDFDKMRYQGNLTDDHDRRTYNELRSFLSYERKDIVNLPDKLTEFDQELIKLAIADYAKRVSSSEI